MSAATLFAMQLAFLLAAPPGAALPSRAFVELCAVCHGQGGRGDGPAASLYAPPPRDLATGVFRNGDAPEQIAATLVTGLPGTGMPAFAALPEEERRLLSEEVRALRALGERAPKEPPSALWPSRPLPPLPATGPWTPPILEPLESDLCGRCHPARYQEWSTSRHALAMGEGVALQLGEPPQARCTECHAPLDAQQGHPALRNEGVGCAACHRRGHEKLSSHPPSGLHASGLPVRVESALGRSEQCMPCHNLPATAAAAALGGKPLLDTWREWAASPYLPARLPCQVCHMAGGDHGLRGAHDPEAVRRAVKLEVGADAGRPVVHLTNVGAGHAFPTTATPQVDLTVRQLDAQGQTLVGTLERWTIARWVRSDDGGETWRQLSDTRLLPGERRTWTYAQGRRPAAVALEAIVTMFPDAFYARSFRARAGVDPKFEGPARQAEASGFRVKALRWPWPGP